MLLAASPAKALWEGASPPAPRDICPVAPDVRFSDNIRPRMIGVLGYPIGNYSALHPGYTDSNPSSYGSILINNYATQSVADAADHGEIFTCPSVSIDERGVA
jgi:hypothetical protein